MIYTLFRGDKAIRREAQKDQCSGKKAYKLKEARSTVNKLRKQGRFKRARIYECPLCGHWHIARSRNKNEPVN